MHSMILSNKPSGISKQGSSLVTCFGMLGGSLINVRGSSPKNVNCLNGPKIVSE